MINSPMRARRVILNRLVMVCVFLLSGDVPVYLDLSLYICVVVSAEKISWVIV